MLSRLRRVAGAGALAGIVLFGAEITARADDWIRYGMPFLGTPDDDVDLKLVDSLGVRGRPNGRYLRFRLNNFGFRRDEDITLKPTPGCTRVMVLGASETFGSHEPPGFEYPAQLERALRQNGGCYEVLNGGVAGMSLRHIRYTWDHYWREFEPDLVIVYPSPGFYLAHKVPSPSREWYLQVMARGAAAPRPRLMHRAKLAIEFPDRWQRRRIQGRIRRALAAIPAESLWHAPPRDRLELFSSDLDTLVAHVAAAGATPVLMTHARRIPDPPAAEDEVLLQAWRAYTPRATTTTLVAFDAAGAQATRDVARRHGALIVDIDCLLSGRRALFSDHIHFTTEGSTRVAAAIAQTLLPPDRHTAAGGYVSSRAVVGPQCHGTPQLRAGTVAVQDY